MTRAHADILVIGGGPTGLGAAWRLHELGQTSWCLLEAGDVFGGLARSFVDPQGFTWDVGGHVQFSHYEYFDRVMDTLLAPDQWFRHQRESWVWIRNRWVPYPFQNNIHRLPAADLDACLQGLMEVDRQGTNPVPPANFGEWIDRRYGPGIAGLFLRPYNTKVWAYPPERLNARWVGERVAPVDLTRVLRNCATRQDDVSWGPNSTFRFPKHGGTGSIWSACARSLPSARLRSNARVVKIEPEGGRLHLATGETLTFERLVSTIPLTELARLVTRPALTTAAAALLWSSTNIIGLGIDGPVPDDLRTKCWMYFPEDSAPFYRATVFSNYSPFNVPQPGRQWSLMLEVSESCERPVRQDSLVSDVIAGATASGLITETHSIVSAWRYRVPHGYPTPGLERDAVVDTALPDLAERGIYSRGRFGAWKYEVSNQDHSFMQGVEVVEHLLHGREELTLTDPDHVNAGRHPWPFERWASRAGAGV